MLSLEDRNVLSVFKTGLVVSNVSALMETTDEMTAEDLDDDIDIVDAFDSYKSRL